MSRRSLRHSVLAIAMLAWGAASAADYEVRTVLQPSGSVEETQPLRLIVQIVGETAPEVQIGKLPPLKNLRVLGGPSSQTNHSWVNGKTSSDHRLIWTLLPEQAGTASVPEFEIRIDGRAHTVGGVTIEVRPGSAPPPPGTDPTLRPSASDEPDIFVEARLGKKAAYVGEAIPFTLLLYTAQQGISNLSYVEQPEFEGHGMWVESETFDPDRERETRVIGNRRYLVYPLQRRVIVPTQAGSFDLGKYILQLSVPVGRRDFFGLSTRTRRIVRRSEPLRLEVRPLPSGAPDGFSGLVGRFAVRTQLDRSEATVDDAIALRVTLSGVGSLQSLDTPALELPPDIEAFDPRVVERRMEIADPVKSVRAWEWVLVPVGPGDLQVPSVEFPYFDPEAGEYRTAASDPIPLVVRRGDGGAGGERSARGAVRATRRDLHYIKRLDGDLRFRDEGVGATTMLALAAAPLALAPFLVWFGRRRERLLADRGLVRARKAYPRARRALAALGKQGEQLDAAAFHEQLGRALVDYVADRVDRSASGMTYELTEELLAVHGIDPDTRRRYRRCLEQCDYARFVPASGKSERRAELLAEALEVLQAVESEWR